MEIRLKIHAITYIALGDMRHRLGLGILEFKAKSKLCTSI